MYTTHASAQPVCAKKCSTTAQRAYLNSLGVTERVLSARSNAGYERTHAYST
jgi:hypothetical protein